MTHSERAFGDSLRVHTILARMKTLDALLVVSSICLSASAQGLPPAPINWGPSTDGVRISLSLDKLTYAVGEDIPVSYTHLDVYKRQVSK